jgi:hypothetical protein
MGDRALIQFEDSKGEVSPVVYLHWHGDVALEYIDELKSLMADRTDDVPYATARFIGICHSHIDGNLSLGVWNQPERLTADDSHGDNGCFLVHVDTWLIERFG